MLNEIEAIEEGFELKKDLLDVISISVLIGVAMIVSMLLILWSLGFVIYPYEGNVYIACFEFMLIQISIFISFGFLIERRAWQMYSRRRRKNGRIAVKKP